MPGSDKSLEKALGELSGYLSTAVGPLSSMKEALDCLSDHKKASDNLTDLMEGILGQMKRSKATSLSAQQSDILEAAIKKWSNNNAYKHLGFSEDYSKGALKYWSDAYAELLKATK